MQNKGTISRDNPPHIASEGKTAPTQHDQEGVEHVMAWFQGPQQLRDLRWFPKHGDQIRSGCTLHVRN